MICVCSTKITFSYLRFILNSNFIDYKDNRILYNVEICKCSKNFIISIECSQEPILYFAYGAIVAVNVW